jgi:uncharacterized protein involved in exopolysaccharide biosynthesis
MKFEERALIRAEDTSMERRVRQPLPTARDVVSVLFRQRRIMLVAAATVAILVLLSGVWAPKYEAQMKILVERQRSDRIVTPSADAPPQYSSDSVTEEELNSEAELLNSSDLLRKVALTTGLGGHPGAGTDTASNRVLANVLQRLSRDLKVEPVHRANVILVSYRSGNPKQAEEVLKALAAAYTEKHLEVHRPSGELKFFEAQADQYQHRVHEAQDKLTDFTRTTGTVSAQEERDSALQQAETFEATARQAQTALVETEQRVNTLREELQSMSPRITTQVRTADNPQLLQQLKSTLLNLQIKRTELLTKFEPTYRLVIEVDRQIAETQSAIAAEDRKPIRDETSDQNPDYEWVRAELLKAVTSLHDLKARAAATTSMAGKYRQDAERLSQQMLQQQGLLQNAQTQQQNYLLYQRKREEARVSNALDLGGILNVAVVEQPTVPAIPLRSSAGIAFIALLLMMMVSVSTAFLADAMAPTFRTPDEVVRQLGLPVLAALPRETA